MIGWWGKTTSAATIHFQKAAKGKASREPKHPEMKNVLFSLDLGLYWNTVDQS